MMCEIKRKFVKLTWKDVSIEKIEIVEEGKHNFIVDSFNGDILQLMNSLNDDLKFIFKGDQFFMYIKDDIDPITIKHNDKTFFRCCSESFTIPINPSKRNSLTLAKELLKLFELKYEQKKIRKKIKTQLDFLGYNPSKIKTLTGGSHVTVITKLGRLTINTKHNQATLENIVFNGDNYISIEQIENMIENKMKKYEEELKILNDMRESYSELSFDICNIVI